MALVAAAVPAAAAAVPVVAVALRNPNRIAQIVPQIVVVVVAADFCASCPPYASFYASLCASGDDMRADRMWGCI